jgi:replicative DNA helicase
MRRVPDPNHNSLPKNLEAERFVLAAILNESADFVHFERALNAGDFSLEGHRRIFLRMHDLHARGEGIDRVTVANELKRHEELGKDGVSCLASLDDDMPRLVNPDSWIRILKHKSGLRQIVHAAHELEKRALLDIDEPAELITSTTVL